MYKAKIRITAQGCIWRYSRLWCPQIKDTWLLVLRDVEVSDL